jgi:hypothetical protein
MLGLNNRSADDETDPTKPDVRRVQPQTTPMVGQPQPTPGPEPTPGPAGSPISSPRTGPQAGPGSLFAGLSAPGGIGGGGVASGATPSRPDAPTPVASQPPAPFMPMNAGMQPTAGRMLFGRAGGLMGGGLGVPGALGGQESGTDADALATLLKMLGGGQQGG